MNFLEGMLSYLGINLGGLALIMSYYFQDFWKDLSSCKLNNLSE